MADTGLAGSTQATDDRRERRLRLLSENRRECERGRLQDVLNEAIGFRARLRDDPEVCWALWLAREPRAHVRKGAIQLIMNRCGPLPLTLLWIGLIAGSSGRLQIELGLLSGLANLRFLAHLGSSRMKRAERMDR